jgi:ArsR family transcriptional regulator
MNDGSPVEEAMTPSPSPAPTAPAGAKRRAAGRDLELARLAKALGHPARIAILRMLAATGDCQCSAIVDRLPLAQATVSQHLKVLKDAGLIRGTIDPPRVCYCVNTQTVERLKALVQEL